MRNIKVESPTANGAVSFHFVSNRTGEAVSAPEILTPDRNVYSVSLGADQDVSLVWRRLGDRTEVLRIAPDADAVTLSDPTLSGPVIPAVAEDDDATPPAPRRRKRRKKVTREEEDEEFEDEVDGDGEDGAEDYASNRPRSEAVAPPSLAEFRIGSSAQKLFDQAVARSERRNERSSLDLRFDASVQKFALKARKTETTRESSSEWPVYGSREYGDREYAISRVVDSIPSGALSIGAATDSSPARYGGWVAYDGRQSIKVRRRFGKLTFEIPPPELGPERAPGTDSKLRFTVAAANRKQVRFLVPRFLKGTRIVLTGEGVSNYDIRFEVEPVDPNLQVVAQSLVVANEEDAKAVAPLVWQTVEDILSGLDHGFSRDPWAAIVMGLAVRRHKWPVDCNWCVQLAEQFPWISDALVLAGWWYSTSGGGRRLDETIELLSRARRLGAPYFAETNAILRDLLVWLSDQDANEAMTALAKHELSMWRSKVPYQSWAGVTFAWLVDRSTKNGRLNRNVDRPVYTGKIADIVGSTDPNKGRFGGSCRSNGRVLSATHSATEDANWTRIELKVESAPNGRPLKGIVEFHLHPTFPQRIESKTVIGGVALHTFEAWGAFTVGAVADDGETRLEFDLAELPGCSDLFRSR